jgi:hypothetical protein
VQTGLNDISNRATLEAITCAQGTSLAHDLAVLRLIVSLIYGKNILRGVAPLSSRAADCYWKKHIAALGDESHLIPSGTLSPPQILSHFLACVKRKSERDQPMGAEHKRGDRLHRASSGRGRLPLLQEGRPPPLHRQGRPPPPLREGRPPLLREGSSKKATAAASGGRAPPPRWQGRRRRIGRGVAAASVGEPPPHQ